MNYTYEQIKPLIKKETLDGIQLKISFQAPGQLNAIDAIGIMTATQKDMVKKMKKTALKQGLFSAAISFLSRIAGGAVGGLTGSAIRTTTSTVGHAAIGNQMNASSMLEVKDTPENRQKTALNAFESVATFFEYNETTKVWSAKSFEIPKA